MCTICYTIPPTISNGVPIQVQSHIWECQPTTEPSKWLSVQRWFESKEVQLSSSCSRDACTFPSWSSYFAHPPLFTTRKLQPTNRDHQQRPPKRDHPESSPEPPLPEPQDPKSVPQREPSCLNQGLPLLDQGANPWLVSGFQKKTKACPLFFGKPPVTRERKIIQVQRGKDRSKLSNVPLAQRAFCT